MQNINQIIESLKQELNATGGIPFMEGRKLGEISANDTLVISDFGYINDKKKGGHYSVFITKGNDELMFFGGQVLTDGLKSLEQKVTKEILVELLSIGIPVKFLPRVKSKNGFEYVPVEFFPEV